MNELINRATSQITHYPGNRDPFETVGNTLAPRDMIGLPLRYKKGDFVLGDESVDLGTVFVAVMPLMLIGWQRWESFKPTDKVLARVSFGERAPDRSELGDNDRSLWEGDKDPWSPTVLVPMVRVSDGTACTFQSSSWGGRKALGELARAFAKGRQKNPSDHLPLIELRSRSRNSQDYGAILEPMFPLVAWEPIALHRDALDAVGILELLRDEPPPIPKANDTFAPNARARQAMADEMNDEIPF